MKPRKIIKSEEANRLTIRRRKIAKSHQRSSKNYNPGGKLPAPNDQDISTRTSLSTQQQDHTCAGCNEKILDRYLLSACNKFWHDNCLKCDRCQAKLGELGSTLYEKGNMNLCRQDYFEMFGRKSICSVCDKLIYASEMVMRAKQNVYHLECFACQLCGLRFCVGDRFYLFENKIVCQYDYDEHLLPIQESMRQQQQQGQTLAMDHLASENQRIGGHTHESAMTSGDLGPDEPVRPDGPQKGLGDENKNVPQLIQEQEPQSDTPETSARAIPEGKD